MIKDGKRALAHIEEVVSIKPIEGADNIELIQVLGWQLVAAKDEFKVGDLCVYIEIDSQVPETDERFKFLSKKSWKVKTMKLGKFNVISQGLALQVGLFPEIKNPEIGQDVTSELGITKIQTEEDIRLAKEEKRLTKQDKDAIIAKKFSIAYRKHKKFFESKLGKKLAKKKFWRRFFGWLWCNNSALKENEFPKWIKKTDEERVENLPWVLSYDKLLIATEKVDGTSTTFAIRYKGKKYKHFEYYVCSRNVRQSNLDMDDETNVYWQMFKKYNIGEVLQSLAKELKCEVVILQGETFGAGIQANPYKLKDVRFMGYNLIIGKTLSKKLRELAILHENYVIVGDVLQRRLDSILASEMLKKYKIDWVPILSTSCELPNTIEEVKDAATGNSMINTDVLREGIVYRSLYDNISFKNVSREYLLKHRS